MKLVVQIPAYNEEKLIERAVDDVRRQVPLKFFNEVEIVIIDDGSTDNTIQEAQKANIRHIVSLKGHGGLGVAFKRGLVYSLDIGADVIVNIDADLQYHGEDIRLLVEPIVKGKADMVIGNRQLALIPGYPMGKRMAQETGNHIMSCLYHADIKDSTSGFRAMSRDCARSLASWMVNSYTYTIESTCILLNHHQRIVFVPVQIRKPTRESRLIKNRIYYIQNYLCTLFRCFFSKGGQCQPLMKI